LNFLGWLIAENRKKLLRKKLETISKGFVDVDYKMKFPAKK